MASRSAHFLFAASAALIASAPAVSVAALGDSLVSTGGTITVTFEGASATFQSSLRLVADGYSSGPIFPDLTTAQGTTFTFASLPAGTPFSFQLVVANTGDTWQTGPASGNADGIAHARVIENWNGTGRTYVAFEDQRGGGDRDYNDFTFSFNVTPANPVPEPQTYALLASGLGMIGFLARRRKKNSA
jgi:hypothetical protein